MSKNYLKSTLSLLLVAFSFTAFAQVNNSVVSYTNSSSSFPLVSNQKAATIFYDNKDALVVAKVARFLQHDIMEVTSLMPAVKDQTQKLTQYPVIIGTIGQSVLIDKLIATKKLDVSKVVGHWESFGWAVIDKPASGVKKALVIFGNDRRGTAFGTLELSKKIGVSPFGWWADVPSIKKKEIYITKGELIMPSPSVKYRGIFINDEDWGMYQWASKTFEKDLKDIGPKTYAKVFELLLRLKANTIWPAMHPISGAFFKFPDNKKVADSFAIVTGSSHPEPLMFNNASEWHHDTMGDWNYDTNKAGILKALGNRVAENAGNETVYTIALRGIHDAGMINNLSDKDKVKLLENAINDERNLLTTNLKKPIEEVPQVFIPYKEVLEVYERGLKVPDDVTLVWPDDNFGYIKRLSNADERKRKGGSGVYYHVSYLGEPHDYLWFSSTPPALMYEELSKAYSTGADQFWMLNVGDLKGSEYSMDLFLDMAWDISKFSFDNIHTHQANWLSNIYGKKYQTQFEGITNDFYHLAFPHKPEFMGGGVEWINGQNKDEKLANTQFSLYNYNEAQARLDAYTDLSKRTQAIYSQLPENQQPSFFQLMYYPVKGSELMNKKMLWAQQNRAEALAGFTHANVLKDSVLMMQKDLDDLTKNYNSLLGGKWDKMMSIKSGYTSKLDNLPVLDAVSPQKNGDLKVTVSGEELNEQKNTNHQLPTINAYDLANQSQLINIYNKGDEAKTWEAKTNQTWIKLSKMKGSTKFLDKILVNIDWDKAPAEEYFDGEVSIQFNNKIERVFVSGFNPKAYKDGSLADLYVEHNGVIAFNAGDFNRKFESKDIKITTVNGLGLENQSVKFGDILDPKQDRWDVNTPRTEYDFYAFSTGRVDVYTYALPTFALDREHDTLYGIGLDKGVTADAVAGAQEYTQLWRDNVLRNFSVCKTSIYIDKPGKHTLQIYANSPGVIVQKVVMDFGGMKKSFLGPKPIKVKK
ncbi:glycosyl hydrolase 115 family protein [Pedobacter changchengzhani]|nr:glycosyl hydrolase 115 family protein [Pedobacter changchengzhani]